MKQGLIKSEAEVALMKKGGAILATTLEELKKLTKPGTDAGFLNEQTERMLQEKGARAAFYGYQGYPAQLCVSLNDEIVHGIPLAGQKIKEGDLVSLDLEVS